MTDQHEVYEAWLKRWSPTRDPFEALTAVRKEVDLQLREREPPLEVRVAALESFVAVWTDFVLSMFYVDEIWMLPPQTVVERCTMAVEFLRLAALQQAIQLDELANEGEEE
jgi:hypothetical protein